MSLLLSIPSIRTVCKHYQESG